MIIQQACDADDSAHDPDHDDQDHQGTQLVRELLPRASQVAPVTC